DHRCVAAVRELEPALTGVVLIAETATVSPAALAHAAGAAVYAPGWEFVDAALVREAHAHGVRVVPWTGNDEAVWRRLLDWGVDGLTTDFPDRLAAELLARGVRC